MSDDVIKRIFAPAALVGQIYAREYGSTTAPLPIGNVLAAELSHKEDVKKQPNMTTLGGGTHSEIRRVTEVELAMTLADINPINLARATQGTVSGVEQGQISNETLKVTRGGLLRTKHLQPSNVVLTKGTTQGTATVTDEEHLDVKKGDLVALAHTGATDVTVRIGDSVATATALTMAGNYSVTAAGIQLDPAAPDVTDGKGIWVNYKYQTVGDVVPAAGNYEVRPAGIFVFQDATGLAEGEEVKVAYSHVGYAVIEALTTKPKELEIILEGLNEADDGKLAIVEIWRASQGVASSIALLQESGFINLKVTGSVLMDSTKVGNGISKYYRVRKT
ncbi:hypothetical protein DJFAAGMI_04158 [Comamonas sp. PE63]|uniref:Uncharacterized protein n=1 Tax=Comamonas brasiliensis TaxID=1812482 RepID=A0ABS5LYP5_9BURK|nr:hypothetical protein [Comamonas sp. PE63]MBS3021386.1 hypothetical protein [Comamonas sp. PE63]